MKTHRMNILPGVLGGLAALSLVLPSMAAASSKDGKTKSGVYSAAATEMAVPSTRETPSHSADLSDRKPGPAWKTIGGTIKHMKSDVYTVEDYEGNQVQLYISRETKQLRGSKKVGDRVRAEITRGGFANSIQ